ncbi:glycosyltransferase family 4 protein [Pseudomonas jinjuensis]|uniref:Glycosyltransferase involved in cell wall bisynthesis n=1 Tax=Pseudomonas jinjuensis TaxID=198616 RepID=A0A1G9YFU4_9PSED|nr:glycosyltransferase family 4 protein [Pseudomonas jinjuensis]SDN07892.1 Glycosyltransferase involved in cell wall bisynthesis [Pseudomonas jinjuensis]
MQRDPVVVVVTLACADETTLRAIAEYVYVQSVDEWLWLVCASDLPADLASDPRIVSFDGNLSDARLSEHCGAADAWLFLDQLPPIHAPQAFEQAWWFFRSHPRIPYAALGEDAGVGRLEARRRPGSGCYWMRGQGGFSRAPNWHLPRGSKHLLMLLPWLEPGGADRCNLDIATRLIAQGWTLTVAATLEAAHRWAPRFRELTDDILVLPSFLAAEASTEFLARLLETRSPDLVLLSNCRFAYESLDLIHRLRPGVPVIDLNHMEEDWEAGGFPGMACRYDAALGRHWVVSQHLQRWMHARGVPMSRIDVLHWFADSCFWRPDQDVRLRLRRQLGIDMRTPVIAYAGRLCQQKRPDLFVRSLRELADKGCDFAALVIGDGELAGQLRSALRREGLTERVHMLGWLDDEGLRQAFQAADLFFLPSESEGIALVLYEAMACGLAVVAADVGGQAELVSPECGHLIAPMTNNLVAAYADALEQLVCNREALRDMGRAARRRIIEKFDTGYFTERLLHLLGEAEWVSVPNARGLDDEASRTAVAQLQWQWNSRRLLAAFGRWKPGQVIANSPPVRRAVKAAFHMKAFGLARTWARHRKQGITDE